MFNAKSPEFWARVELARRDLFEYCNLLGPDFYKRDREHLRVLCNEIQQFLDSDENVLTIALPPRFGKSRTGKNACAWLLGNRPDTKIMVASYNETLATQFSKQVRDQIQTQYVKGERPTHSLIFPNCRIKRGDGAMNLWALEGQDANYLASSPDGTMTGMGADLIIIDDLVKNPEEALNVNHTNKLWNWVINNTQQRFDSGQAKYILIMTPWSELDVMARAKRDWSDVYKMRHVELPAADEEGNLLCEEILDHKGIEQKRLTMSPEIFQANYFMRLIDASDRLYPRFSTYDTLPTDTYGNSLFDGVYAYCDTADTGDDYLCLIIYGIYQDRAYVLDVYYTQDAMEITERKTAQLLAKHEVNVFYPESNNGGRGFARAVSRELKGYKWRGTTIRPFHQSQNKDARIRSNATFVMDYIYFPADWATRWEDYYLAMTQYSAKGGNKRDDAPDATTGVAEKMSRETYVQTPEEQLNMLRGYGL